MGKNQVLELQSSHLAHLYREVALSRYFLKTIVDTAHVEHSFELLRAQLHGLDILRGGQTDSLQEFWAGDRLDRLRWLFPPVHPLVHESWEEENGWRQFSSAFVFLALWFFFYIFYM